MKNKIKAILKRGKAFIAAAAIALTSAMTAVVACADGADEAVESGTDLMQVAGDTLISTFEGLISTMIPVVMGILSSGLVIFGIMALVKLGKKVFTKVAG